MGLDPNLQTLGTYEELIPKAFAPTWLAGPYGTAYFRGLGISTDNEWNLAKAAAKVGFPFYAPSDGLDPLGAERMLERIRPSTNLAGETELDFRGRVQGVWGSWDAALAAPVTTYALHAPIAGGAPLNVTTGWIDPPVLGLVTISLGVGGTNPTSYTLTGLNQNGNPQSEIIVAAGPGNYTSVKYYSAVDLLTSDVDPVSVTAITISGMLPAIVGQEVQRYALPQGIWEASGSAAIHMPAVFPTNSPPLPDIQRPATMTGWPHWLGLTNTGVYRQHEWSSPPYLIGPTFFAWENKWSTFWVLIRQPHPFTLRVWGVGVWGQPATWGTSATTDEVALIKRLVVNFKSGHSSCAGIVLQFGTGHFWGDGVWGVGTWGGTGLATVIWPVGETSWY